MLYVIRPMAKDTLVDNGPADPILCQPHIRVKVTGFYEYTS